MTLKEVAQQLRLSENTIYRNFKRTQDNLAKFGIVLTKWGKGEHTEYEIEYEELESE